MKENNEIKQTEQDQVFDKFVDVVIAKPLFHELYDRYRTEALKRAVAETVKTLTENERAACGMEV